MTGKLERKLCLPLDAKVVRAGAVKSIDFLQPDML